MDSNQRKSGQKFPTLWSKKWWLFVFTPIATVLLLVILLLILFLAVVPAVARSHAKSTTITMESMKISSPTNTGFTLSGQQKLSKIPLNPRIDAFSLQIADMQDIVLFNMSIPSFKGSKVVIEEQEVSIISADAYVDFAKQLLQQNETRLRVYGETKVNILTRSVPITMDTIVTVGGLKDLTVAVASVTDRNGTFDAHSRTTYAASPVSLDLGPSEFHLLYQDVVVANLSGAIDLQPGTHDFNTTGKTVITGLTAQPTKLISFLRLINANSSIPVTVQGVSNAQSSWASASLQAFTRNTTISSAQIREAIASAGLDVSVLIASML